MTDPRKYLFRMLIFIFIVSAIVVVLNNPLIGAFQANIAINGLILSVLFIGIIFLCRQTIKLVPEIISSRRRDSLRPFLLCFV